MGIFDHPEDNVPPKTPKNPEIPLRDDSATGGQLNDLLRKHHEQGASLPFENMDRVAQKKPQALEASNVVTLPQHSQKSPSESLDMPPVRSSQPTLIQKNKARWREELYFQKRRKLKKRQIVLNRIRSFLRVVAAAMMIVSLYLFLKASFWAFVPDQFTLSGNQLLTRAHIERFLQPLGSMPLFRMNPLVLANEIRQELPLVDQIYIRRHLFPTRLDIQVVEKPSWGVVYSRPPESLLPVLSDSVSSVSTASIKPSSKKLPDDVPLKPSLPPVKPAFLIHWDGSLSDLASYTVTPKDLTAMGNPIVLVSDNMSIKTLDLNALRQVAQFLNSQPAKAKMLYLDVSNPMDLVAYFQGFQVHFGLMDRTVLKRLAPLFVLLPNIEAHEGELQFVDLRWNQQIIFKKKPKDALAAKKPQASPSSDSSKQPALPLSKPNA